MKKIVLCGYGNLAKKCVIALEKEGYKTENILTHKDLTIDGLDTYAKNKNIEFTYKDSRKNIEIIKKVIEDKKIDYLISINYRYIIPEEIFILPKYSINIHGSLLPKYRGRTPHVWSIINGEKYAGITCHLIDKGIDTGKIIEQKKVEITSEDTGYTLLNKYERLYPQVLINSLKKLEQNYKPIIQKEDNASYFGKRTPDMGYIDFYKTSEQIINFVRAQANPYPGAYYYLTNGQKITINKLEKIKTDIPELNSIGVIKKIKNTYYVKCLNSILKIINFNFE